MIFGERGGARRYGPKGGETLESIARRESAAGTPLTWQEIARYNWGTDDPDVVNEHLRDELGCRHRDADKNFVIADDDHRHGDLLIPAPAKKAGLRPGRTHVLRIRQPSSPPQFVGCCLVPGVTFQFDKSFVRPSVAQHLGPLEEALGKHPEAKVVVFGHTDKVSDELYNKGLSERRARSMYAFITNQPAIWEELHQQEGWGIQAVQEILADLGGEFDPGPVDGIEGSKTRQAVKNYQSARGLATDGIAGPTTRAELFAEYMSGKHDVEIGDEQFLAPKFMGCSEFNPVEPADGPSEPNRRVTFFLFDPARPPRFPCALGDLGPCEHQAANPEHRFQEGFRCSFYDSIAKDCGCEQPGGGETPSEVLQIALPTVERRQFVNLSASPDHEERARKVVVEARIEPPRAGVDVFWAFEADSTIAWHDEKGKSIEDAGLGAKLRAGFGKAGGPETAKTQTGADGVARVDFFVSQYGGDEYVVTAGLAEGDSDAKAARLQVWRRLWYQMTHDAGLSLPDCVNSRKAYEGVGAELVETTAKKFEKDETPSDTYYPSSMIEPGSGAKEVAVIGSHNKSAFEKFYVAEADKPVKAHLIVCEHQWDAVEWSDALNKAVRVVSKTLSFDTTKRTSDEVMVTVPVFKPALEDGLIVTATWRTADGRSGNLSEDDLVFEADRGKDNEMSLRRCTLRVKLPAAVKDEDLAGGKKVRVRLKLRGAAGPFLGESGKPHMLVVYDASDEVDFQNTVTHEIGHAVNQTPGPEEVPDGMKKHPHQYTGHGGQGPHCNTVLVGGKQAEGTLVTASNGKKVYDTGICVMFASKDSTCINEFCDTCKPYLRAQEMTHFT